MRLAELEPRWIEWDGRRVGLLFRSPTNRAEWQSCFEVPPSISNQMDIFDALMGESARVQPCNPEARWTVAGGLAAADFDTLTVTPSLDGSAGGLWHGHITNGEIVGGL